MPVNDVKALITKEGTTQTAVVKKMFEKFGIKMSLRVLSSKFSKRTLRFEEAEKIADILGYDLEFKKR